MVKIRGAIDIDDVIPNILVRDYRFLAKQKMGFYIIYENKNYCFYAVDRFASFPIFYTVRDKKPIVSEKVDELLPYVEKVVFDPEGYYGAGGARRGNRSFKTPYKNILRIPPGHYLIYDKNKFELHKYWSFEELADKPFKGSFEEASEELGFLINQAIKRCYKFTPDAALHLSGGLDSGIITSIYGKLSPTEIETYTFISDKAPIYSDEFESGFIGKYKNYLPNININRVDPTKSHSNPSGFFPEADNWHGLHNSHPECKVLEDAQRKGKKYILTGLGGDELATYGFSTQRLSFIINSDEQARNYLNWHLMRKPLLKNIVKTLLGKNGNLRNAYRNIKMQQIVNSKTIWYTSNFKQILKEQFNLIRPPLISIPSSFEYKLKLLDQSFFTYRSDAWNFLGRHYKVSYLHPLLDADLVEFCARLPPRIFNNKPNRALIKTALRRQFPSELLKSDAERGTFYKARIKKSNLLKRLKYQNQRLTELSNTFAGSVYDFVKMQTILQYCIFLVNNTPENQQSIYLLINFYLGVTTGMVTKAVFLNYYFN